MINHYGTKKNPYPLDTGGNRCLRNLRDLKDEENVFGGVIDDGTIFKIEFLKPEVGK